MIRVNDNLSLDESELVFDYIQSSGPGGQNVNKVATAVQLRFDAGNSASLPLEVRQRLLGLAGKRLTGEGVVLIQANRFRTQERNRQDALGRLVALVARAAVPPKPRLRTQPTAASRQRRLEAKRHHSQVKRLRGHVDAEK